FPINLGLQVAVVGDPAAGDLSGSGHPEVVAALSDGRLVAVKAGGALRVIATGPVSNAGPSIADLDGDGKPEIVIGTRDGLLHAYRAAAAAPKAGGSNPE